MRRIRWWMLGLLVVALGTLVGGVDVLCPMFEEKIQVHNHTNVTDKPCHLLMREGTPVADVVAYQGQPCTGIGGSNETDGCG